MAGSTSPGHPSPGARSPPQGWVGQEDGSQRPGGERSVALREGVLSGAVLDVWAREPDIDKELLELVDIGTSHIAGYSYDGKVKGTRMVFDAICEFFSIDKEWKVELPPPEIPYIDKTVIGKCRLCTYINHKISQYYF